ncbi:MAG: hypothetical protein CMJ32_01355 [Phycisphaerae bacterium]|nr:hypothetical protein [Phycisphaerae bacterium]
MIRSMATMALSAACMQTLAGCGTPPQPEPLSFTRAYMGVQATILVGTSRDRHEEAVNAAVAAFERIQSLESCYSTWRDDSEINRFHRSTTGEWVILSDDLFDLLDRSHEYALATDGAFDVTQGRAIRLARGAIDDGYAPSSTEIQHASASGGWAHLHLDRTHKAAMRTREELRLDFGGIGKGYAADKALDVLAELGFESALVDIGGDIAVGRAYQDRPWRIQVQPGYGSDPIMLELSDCGIATSGTSEQSLQIDSVTHSHIIDPGSGRAVTGRSAVTVIAPDATTADVFASALSVHDGLETDGSDGQAPRLTVIRWAEINGILTPGWSDPARRLQASPTARTPVSAAPGRHPRSGPDPR